MPCPFRSDIILIANAFPRLLIDPTSPADDKLYALVSQRKVINPQSLIETIRTICMSSLFLTEIIQLIKIERYLSALNTHLFARGKLPYLNINYIKVIQQRWRKD